MLDQYRKKRKAGVTPEPGLKAGTSGKGRRDALTFVVQRHDATRLHYDFRLECDEALKSWAVPKGPSIDPSVKRLSVMVEDHPLSYASFEGKIPEGEYGGGEVIIWDEGTYAPEDAPEGASKAEQEKIVREGIAKGKLSFVVHGTRLKGAWTLVRTRQKDQWLLMKQDDSEASRDLDILKDERSVVSGRTVEDIEAGRPPKPKKASSRKPKAAFPAVLTPMLATEVKAAFDSADWTFEVKLDGIRAIAMVDDGLVTLLSRNGKDITAQFPEVVSALRDVPAERFVVDGELVIMDGEGRPSFQSLMDRFHLQNERTIRERMAAAPTVFYVFDLLYHEDRDLRLLPYRERRAVLESMRMGSRSLKRLDSFPQHGIDLYSRATEMGFEGVVGKRLDSAYLDGVRSPHWVKVKSYNSAEFVVGGFTTGEGARRGTFGALLLGEYVDGQLVYVGSVGGGFTETILDALKGELEKLGQSECPFRDKPALRSKAHWVEPKMWVEVRFMTWTRDRRLRFPIFVRRRPDLESGKSGGIAAPPLSTEAPASSATIESILAQLAQPGQDLRLELEGAKLDVTSLDRVFWPGDKERPAVTKRDYLRYLTRMSPYMLPHLKDRPITLTRYPEGIHGEKFFQKHADKAAPPFIERIDIYSKRNGGARGFFLCNGLPTLLWIGQIGGLEVHPWYSRISTTPDAVGLGADFASSEEAIDESVLNYPDFMVIDLDPYLYAGTEAPGDEPAYHERGYKEACEIALQVKEMLDDLKATPFVKTSGKTGLHIYVPIERMFDYDDVRAMAETLGIQMVRRNPDRVTLEWAVPKRTGKVFFDYNQNARGKTLASVYSPRPTAAATVSFPLSWDSLMTANPWDFTVHTAPSYVSDRGDLWARILEEKRNFGQLFA